MLRFYADKFVTTLDDMSAIRVLCSQQSGNSGASFKADDLVMGRLRDLQKQVMEMKLHLTANSVGKIISTFESNHPQPDRLEFLLSEAHSRLTEELERLLVFCIQDNAELFEPKQPLFGELVSFRLPRATIDIEEAGKCLALGRGTAAVFHLMRVMEAGLKELARMLDIPYAPSWESYIKQIGDKIAAKHDTKAIDWKKDEPFYRDVLGDLTSVKMAWRNPTMHVVNDYSPDQAEDVFRAVRAFIKRLVPRLPESEIEKLLG